MAAAEPQTSASRASRNGCGGAVDQRPSLSPPICGGFASAICRCWVRGWGSGRANAKARAPSSRPTPRHFSIQEKKWYRPTQPTQRASAEQPEPQTSRPNPRVSVGRRSRQYGSRRRCRHPERFRSCEIACAAGGSLSAHSEASTERVPRRRPTSCPARSIESEQGGRPHVHRDQSNVHRALREMGWEARLRPPDYKASGRALLNS